MIILYADDNPGDQRLVWDALQEIDADCSLVFVDDGKELIDYLRREGRYQSSNAPRPDVILIDLNMPRKSGIEALAEIKRDPALSSIPAVVLTSSRLEADVDRAYDTGATAYLKKPTTFTGLVKTMRAMVQWWAETVLLPPKNFCLPFHWEEREEAAACLVAADPAGY